MSPYVFTGYICHDIHDNILIGVIIPDPYVDHYFIYALHGDFDLIGVGDFDSRVTGARIRRAKSGR